MVMAAEKPGRKIVKHLGKHVVNVARRIISPLSAGLPWCPRQMLLQRRKQSLLAPTTVSPYLPSKQHLRLQLQSYGDHGYPHHPLHQSAHSYQLPCPRHQPPCPRHHVSGTIYLHITGLLSCTNLSQTLLHQKIIPTS